MSEYSEVRRTYLNIFDGGKMPVMIYEPLHPGERAKIGVVLMHSDDNYIEYAPAKALAERGYRVAAAQVVRPHANPLDGKVRNVAKVVSYLKNYPGVEKVLLLGHSGGATLMSAYQNVAENGVSTFQGAERIIPFDNIDPVPAADGVMLLDANFGNGVMSLLSLDPSIIDEKDPRKRDASLNLFNPENGYDRNGCHFSEEFIHRYWKAQGQRMNRLIEYCQERLGAIAAGNGMFDDDEPLFIAGGTQIAPCNKLFPQMPERFFSHTEGEAELVHKDGTVTKQIVPCLRLFRPGADSTPEYGFGCNMTTVKQFLKSSAVRVDPETYGYDETTLHGVQWRSSYCVTVGNVDGVTVPMLFMGMTGSYEYIAAEHAYKNAVLVKDKTLAFVEGAGHNFVVDPEVREAHGDLGDTVRSCFDYVSDWIDSRFL